MNKKDYLKLAILNDKHKEFNWVLTAFSVTREKDSVKNSYLKIVRDTVNCKFVNENNELEVIEGSKYDEPIFTFKDEIEVDSTWLVNISEPIKTTIGILLYNSICITSAFGNKIPYVNERINISKLEDRLAKLLHDTPIDDQTIRANDKIYVDELVKFNDAHTYLEMFSKLCIYAATPKNIVEPEGIEEFKKQLLIKYEGKLNDAVALADFEKELMNFDNEYLKDDPSNGKFLTGKSKDVARKKLYLTVGAENTFEDDIHVKPIISSLSEGWTKNPEDLKLIINDLRVGSYSRGAETVNGGVAAKVLLRATNNYKIADYDCETQLGINRDITDAEQLINRYIIDKGKLIHINNLQTANNYVGKNVVVRSPMYCKAEGETICKICAGDNLNKFPTGLAIPLTEISGIILTASLKKMHGTKLSLAELSIEKNFT